MKPVFFNITHILNLEDINFPTLPTFPIIINFNNLSVVSDLSNYFHEEILKTNEFSVTNKSEHQHTLVMLQTALLEGAEKNDAIIKLLQFIYKEQKVNFERIFIMSTVKVFQLMSTLNITCVTPYSEANI